MLLVYMELDELDLILRNYHPNPTLCQLESLGLECREIRVVKPEGFPFFHDIVSN